MFFYVALSLQHHYIDCTDCTLRIDFYIFHMGKTPNHRILNTLLAFYYVHKLYHLYIQHMNFYTCYVHKWTILYILSIDRELFDVRIMNPLCIRCMLIVVYCVRKYLYHYIPYMIAHISNAHTFEILYTVRIYI